MKKKYTDQEAMETIALSNAGLATEQNELSVLPTLDSGDAIIVRKVSINASLDSDNFRRDAGS